MHVSLCSRHLLIRGLPRTGHLIAEKNEWIPWTPEILGRPSWTSSLSKCAQQTAKASSKGKKRYCPRHLTAGPQALTSYSKLPPRAPRSRCRFLRSSLELRTLCEEKQLSSVKVLVRVSMEVMGSMTRSNFGTEGSFQLTALRSCSLTEGTQEPKGLEAKTKAEAVEGCCSLACSSCLAQPAFLQSPGQLFRDSTAWNVLDAH
jgi:hypothetical protein